MADGKSKTFDLGDGAKVVCHVSEDAKRLRIESDVDQGGLTKTQVNGLIDALKKTRGKMER